MAVLWVTSKSNSQRAHHYRAGAGGQDKTVDPHQPKPDDSPGVAAWRARMAKAIYKNRAATAECVNAQSRNRGLQQFRVRGLAKVKCVVLFFALAHNLMRMASLAPEMLALGKVRLPCPESGLERTKHRRTSEKPDNARPFMLK